MRTIDAPWVARCATSRAATKAPSKTRGNIGVRQGLAVIIRQDSAAQRHSVIFQKVLRGGAVCAGVFLGSAAALAVPEIVKIDPLPVALASLQEQAPKIQARLDRGLRFASAPVPVAGDYRLDRRVDDPRAPWFGNVARQTALMALMAWCS